MERYKNLSGDSGVSEYEIGADYIAVKFINESPIYIYNYSLTGKYHVETMKTKAIKGIGLSSYISKNPDVKNHYKKL